MDLYLLVSILKIKYFGQRMKVYSMFGEEGGITDGLLSIFRQEAQFFFNYKQAFSGERFAFLIVFAFDRVRGKILHT